MNQFHPAATFRSLLLLVFVTPAVAVELTQVVSPDNAPRPEGKLTVRFPSEIWTAGEPVALKIEFEAGDRPIRPRWRVWLAPLGTPYFVELPHKDGKITPPATGGGLYHLRVCPGLLASPSEYQVQSIIEIRQPNSQGALSVFSPRNRIYYRQGEEVPLSVICRTSIVDPPRTVTLRLVDEDGALLERTLNIQPNEPEQFTLSGKLTAALRPGRYQVTAVIGGTDEKAGRWTSAPQHLSIGRGLPSSTAAFGFVRQEDHPPAVLKASYLDTPQVAAQYVERARKLGVNSFAGRAARGGAAARRQSDAAAAPPELLARLEKDHSGVAREKAVFDNVVRQAAAALGMTVGEKRGRNAGPVVIGGLTFPTLPQMVMHGDGRSATGAGAIANRRKYGEMMRQLGPWLQTLSGNERVAIVVSNRMLKTDTPKDAGARYATRLYEASSSCLYAHRPARLVFQKDMKPDVLKKYRVVLVVGQQVELEAQFQAKLEAAQQAGLAVFYDDTCRAELLKKFKPLRIAFNQLEQEPRAKQSDFALRRRAKIFKQHAGELLDMIGHLAPPVAECDDPEIHFAEHASGPARFVWVVNHKLPPLPPGQKQPMGKTKPPPPRRMPVVVDVDLKASGNHVYEYYSGDWFGPNHGKIAVDLRSMPMRLYAILPQQLGSIYGESQSVIQFGGKLEWKFRPNWSAANGLPVSLPIFVQLRDDKVIAETHTASGLNGGQGTFNVPINLRVYTSRSVLQGMPSVAGLNNTEAFSQLGGHTVIWAKELKPPPELLGPWKLIDRPPLRDRPIPNRRDAVAHRGEMFRRGDANGWGWSRKKKHDPIGLRLTDIAVSADGKTALVSALNWDENLLAIDVKNRGKVNWRARIGHRSADLPTRLRNGWAVTGFDYTTRESYRYLLDAQGRPQRRFAVGALHVFDAGNNTLIALSGATAAAYDAATGEPRWRLKLDGAQRLLGGAASADSKTLAIRSGAGGGRVHIVRGGRVVKSVDTPADALSLSGDGSHLAVVSGRHLKWYATDGGLIWNFLADDRLRGPRVSPNGKHVAVGGELGGFYIFGPDGQLQYARDFGAPPVACWLPDNQLLVGDGTGTLVMLESSWSRFKTYWRVHLSSAANLASDELFAADPTPTTGPLKP